jgi:hypothetical protein
MKYEKLVSFAAFIAVVILLFMVFPQVEGTLKTTIVVIGILLAIFARWYYANRISPSLKSKEQISNHIKSKTRKNTQQITRLTSQYVQSEYWKFKDLKDTPIYANKEVEKNWRKLSRKLLHLLNQRDNLLEKPEQTPQDLFIISHNTVTVWQSLAKVYIQNQKNNDIQNFLETTDTYELLTSIIFSPEEINKLISIHPNSTAIKNNLPQKLYQEYKVKYEETAMILQKINLSSIAKTTISTIGHGTKKIIFPIQKFLTELIGKAKIPIRKKRFIKKELLSESLKHLETFDILLSRKNWEVSNLFLPGFWTHSLIYLGNYKFLSKLEQDQAVKKYLKQNYRNQSLTTIIKKKAPNLLTKITNIKHTYIDATSQGVDVRSYLKECKADYLVALRPKLTNLQKAQVILEICQFHQAPYDYDFNFSNSKNVVCSELIYKTYKLHSNMPVKPIKVAGRYTIPPTLFLKSLQKNPTYWRFVFFIDTDQEKHTTKFQSKQNAIQSINRTNSDLKLEKHTILRSLWQRFNSK